MSRPAVGSRLSVKPEAKQSFEAKRELARLHIGHDAIVHVTFVDHNGLSIHVNRGVRLANLEAFIPNDQFANWQTYFELGTAFGDARNTAYASSRHATRRFPSGCV